MIPVQCTHCRAVIRLQNYEEAALGHEMRCPQCFTEFIAQRQKDEIDDLANAEFFRDDQPQLPRDQSKRGLTVGRVLLVAFLLFIIYCSTGAARIAIRDFRDPTYSMAKQTGTPQSNSIDEAPIATTPIASGASITDEEFLSFAETLEERVRTERGHGFMRSVNWTRLFERSFQGLQVRADFKRGFMSGVTDGMTKSLEVEFSRAFQGDGHYELLRLHSVDTQKRLLFRMVTPNGLNYHDIELERSPQGELEIVDFGVAVSGEKLSETMRRLISIAAAQKKGTVIQRIAGTVNQFEAHIDTIETFNKQKAAGEYAAALETLKRFPVALKNEKTFALSRILLAGQLDQDEYLAAMGDFRKTFPNEACIDLMAIDYHLLRKEYDQAIAATDRFDRSIGGDPYLNHNRLAIYSHAERWDGARAALEKIAEFEPDSSDIQFAFVNIGLNQRDFDLVLRSLKILKSKFRVLIEDLRTIPAYSEFVRSPQYREWLTFDS